jgi:hypothetical protein
MSGIIFIRYPANRKIGKQDNLKEFGSNKTNGLKQERIGWDHLCRREEHLSFQFQSKLYLINHVTVDTLGGWYPRELIDLKLTRFLNRKCNVITGRWSLHWDQLHIIKVLYLFIYSFTCATTFYIFPQNSDVTS